MFIASKIEKVPMGIRGLLDHWVLIFMNFYVLTKCHGNDKLTSTTV